jgi:hypothetical protein
MGTLSGYCSESAAPRETVPSLEFLPEPRKQAEEGDLYSRVSWEASGMPVLRGGQYTNKK